MPLSFSPIAEPHCDPFRFFSFWKEVERSLFQPFPTARDLHVQEPGTPPSRSLIHVAEDFLSLRHPTRERESKLLGSPEFTSPQHLLLRGAG